MSDYPEISTKVSKALDTVRNCATDETVENYNLLGDQLRDLASASGQPLVSHAGYRPLIDKLEHGTQLTDAEMKTVRSLIIGDADQYLKYDDDFARMKAELNRIVGQIEKLNTQELNVETLMHLRVLCKEASSVLAPTLHYLEQRDRVRKFEEHTGGPLSKDAASMLARIITDMSR